MSTSPSRLTHEETHRRLTEGLLDLIASQPLYEVQVRELCARSGVSRSTFYKHYENMEGFVRALEDEFIEQMGVALVGTNVFLLSLSIDARETFSHCTEFMHRHARFVRPMIGPNGSPSLRGRILDLWTGQVKEALSLLRPLVHPDLDVGLFAACTASAMLTLLELDLLSDGAYTPDYVAGQMAAIIYGCLLKEAISSKAQPAALMELKAASTSSRPNRANAVGTSWAAHSPDTSAGHRETNASTSGRNQVQ